MEHGLYKYSNVMGSGYHVKRYEWFTVLITKFVRASYVRSWVKTNKNASRI